MREILGIHQSLEADFLVYHPLCCKIFFLFRGISAYCCDRNISRLYILGTSYLMSKASVAIAKGCGGNT